MRGSDNMSAENRFLIAALKMSQNLPWGRVIFSTVVPCSGRFQLTNLMGYSYVLRFGLRLGFGAGLWLELCLVSRLTDRAHRAAGKLSTINVHL